MTIEARGSQLLSCWGPGSIIPLPGDKMAVVTDPSLWVYEDIQQHEIVDSRMCNRLGIQHLYSPPGKGSSAGVKVNWFPKYAYCSSCLEIQPVVAGIGMEVRQKCRKLQGYGAGNSCARSTMIPLRLVLACKAGHLSSLDYYALFRRNVNNGCKHDILRFRPAASAEPFMARIECHSCMEHRLIVQLTNITGNDCSGEKPWLELINGQYAIDTNCKEKSNLYLIGSSALHYATQMASVYIPDTLPMITDTVRRSVDNLTNEHGMPLEEIRKILPSNPKLSNFPPMLVRQVISFVLDSADCVTEQLNEIEYRRQEHDFFLGIQDGQYPVNEARPDIVAKSIDFTESLLHTYFSRVLVLEKLRETRVFTGFSRLAQDAQLIRPTTALFKQDSWLPAVTQATEGILFFFRDEAINSWMKNSTISTYRTIINKCKFTTKGERWNPKYFLLHSFSHAMIDAVADESGYPASSLRERIYCDGDNGGNMHAVLIYVTSGDSQGALGGLVRTAKNSENLPRILKTAMHRAAWCSADPVCGSSEGQGSNNTNLAACHYCILLPETSCECFNKFLDRNAMIDENDGYFKDLQ